MDVILCLCGNRVLHETQYATAGLGSTAVVELTLMSLKNSTILSGNSLSGKSAACGILGLHILHQLAQVSEIAGATVGCNWVLGCGS